MCRELRRPGARESSWAATPLVTARILDSSSDEYGSPRDAKPAHAGRRRRREAREACAQQANQDTVTARSLAPVFKYTPSSLLSGGCRRSVGVSFTHFASRAGAFCRRWRDKSEPFDPYIFAFHTIEWSLQFGCGIVDPPNYSGRLLGRISCAARGGAFTSVNPPPAEAQAPARPAVQRCMPFNKTFAS